MEQLTLFTLEPNSMRMSDWLDETVTGPKRRIGFYKGWDYHKGFFIQCELWIRIEKDQVRFTGSGDTLEGAFHAAIANMNSTLGLAR